MPNLDAHTARPARRAWALFRPETMSNDSPEGSGNSLRRTHRHFDESLRWVRVTWQTAPAGTHTRASSVGAGRAAQVGGGGLWRWCRGTWYPSRIWVLRLYRAVLPCGQCG